VKIFICLDIDLFLLLKLFQIKQNCWKIGGEYWKSDEENGKKRSRKWRSSKGDKFCL